MDGFDCQECGMRNVPEWAMAHPESAALVDRARFERLLRIASASGPFLSYTSLAELGDAINDLRGAASSLEPGDLDPLP